MLFVVSADKMSNLCEICLHRDEELVYSHGGAAVVPVCMFNRPNFNLIKRYDQCRDFTNMNHGAGDADTDIPEQYVGPADNRDYHPHAAAPD
jgi:hypothetical protein